MRAAMARIETGIPEQWTNFIASSKRLAQLIIARNWFYTTRARYRRHSTPFAVQLLALIHSTKNASLTADEQCQLVLCDSCPVDGVALLLLCVWPEICGVTGFVQWERCHKIGFVLWTVHRLCVLRMFSVMASVDPEMMIINLHVCPKSPLKKLF